MSDIGKHRSKWEQRINWKKGSNWKQRRKNVISSEDLIKGLIIEVTNESNNMLNSRKVNSLNDLLESKRKLRKSILTVRESIVINPPDDIESEYDSGDSGYDTAPEYDDEKKDAPKRYVVTERGAVVNGLDVAISCLQGVQEYKASLNKVLRTLNGVLHTIAASKPARILHDTSVNLVSMLKL